MRVMNNKSAMSNISSLMCTYLISYEKLLDLSHSLGLFNNQNAVIH